MQLGRVIVSTHLWQDSLSTISENLNTCTRQYAGTKNVPRDPLFGLITLESILRLSLESMR